MDTYQGKRSSSKQREIIESFHYLGFEGPITMKNAEEEFCIFEEWDAAAQNLTQVYFGRRIAGGSRDIILKYDLKKRHYISTTSMDCELALLTANMAHAAKGKMLYDPFVGTGSFTVACGHFGATVLGSDIDGRSIRGKSKEKCLYANFQQYKLEDVFLDSFIADLTNTPLRKDRWIDGIVCDPPYGVREGLKVLGSRDGTKTEPVLLDGALAHL
jgi:tRNA (guanine10-N2)-methyltransferase